jgi:hypothetical protein
MQAMVLTNWLFNMEEIQYARNVSMKCINAGNGFDKLVVQYGRNPICKKCINEMYQCRQWF